MSAEDVQKDRKDKQRRDNIFMILIIVFGFIFVLIASYLYRSFKPEEEQESNPCLVSYEDEECTDEKFMSFCTVNNTNKELVTCKNECYSLSEIGDLKLCTLKDTCENLGVDFPWCS